MAAIRLRVILLASLCAAVLLAFPAISSSEVPRPSGQYGIELEVALATDGATYLCTALISDLETSEILGAPRIQAPVGEEAKATTAFEIEGVRYELVLSVALEGEAFRYRFEAIHGGEVAAVQSGTLKPWKPSG